jgi:SAM-dependent methyltransferase
MSQTLPDPPEHLDPDYFASMGAQFMSAKLLCVAADLGVFEKLGDGPRTLDEMVEATGIPRRSLRVVLNGLAAMNVLRLHDDRYENGEEAQAFLAGRTSVDLRPGLRLYGHLIYPMWMQFENTVRTGTPARSGQPSESFARIFSEGVEAWTLGGALALPKKYDFSKVRRILDVGGGTGSYLLPILDLHPHIRATLYDLPPTVAVAERRLAGQPARDRIDIVEGDAFFDPLPEGHDLVLMGGFIHLFNPDRIAIALDRVRQVVAPGTPLLIVDQWIHEEAAMPQFGAMLAATYLLISGVGDTYSVDEAKPWLDRAGFRFVAWHPLSGPTGVVVAEAR